jgi:Protein of unknown function (DUF2891)
VRSQRISKQDQPHLEQRCGCGSAAKADARVLRLLRLALLSTRTLAPCPAGQAREALRQGLTAENITQEAAYLRVEGRASFERPYGLAWLLQLVAELREWDDPEARDMSASLRPLEQAALERLSDWLPKLSHPVRIGEHDQTAFALGLMLDYARASGDTKFADLLVSKARQFLFRRQRLSTIL